MLNQGLSSLFLKHDEQSGTTTHQCTPKQPYDQPEAATGANLILGIEEPELYLHPSRQRHVARILLQLAEGSIPGVAQRTQVIYGTHSPLFVGIDRGDKVRVLRKVEVGKDQPQEARVSAATMDDINRTLEQASNAPAGSYTAVSTRARLKTIMTPWMNEGFFAHVVVLVEGEEDRALLMGAAAMEDIDFDSLEISVIPAGGKRSLDRPAAIFKGLNIPTYIIWDSDSGKNGAKPEDNHRLLRLCEQEVEDWPSQIASHFACFERNFGATVSDEIGEELWNQLLIESRDHFEYPENDSAQKNPAVVERVVRKATDG
ncbi:MAG: AAA family ATPase, partial [Planctomycetes bacterium]|nr:AAA family ATPase [Planctomycetota bacterium]